MKEKERQLESTVATMQLRHGNHALQRGATWQHAIPHIDTGFVALDQLTGCGGIPAGAITLLSGPSTSGKSTLAYKILANAQGSHSAVALLDLRHTADPDYLHRCGVDLGRLLVVRPTREEESTPLLLDIVHSQRGRCVVVNGLLELTADRRMERQFHGALGRLRQLARVSSCAVVLLAEPVQRWHRWLNIDSTAVERQNASLHIELQHERWLYQGERITGYDARAQIMRSLWRRGAPATTIAIEFNGTVHAREHW